MSRKALGRGLDALFNPQDAEPVTEGPSSGRRIITVSLNDIVPNRDQPREYFDEAAMEDLKRSIAANGILEPPVVRRKGTFFELIAGERRFRAAKELGHETIDVILMEVTSDDQSMVLSLIENIQRQDLNAIEEAKAYQQIMTRMHLTQDDLAVMVGKSRSAIANTLRLLTLAGPVQDMVSVGALAPGSARALVTVSDSNLQQRLAVKIAQDGLSTRKAEELVKHTLAAPEPRVSPRPSPALESARLTLQRRLATEVAIRGSVDKGKIEIAFYSADDLDRLLEAITGE